MKRSHIVIAVVAIVLIIDQALKIYIKTNYGIGGGFKILGMDWARIHFVENNGMAFGITFGDKCIGTTRADGSCAGVLLTPMAGKLILSVFRLVMITFLIYFVRELVKAKESKGLLICLAMILAGAIGNVIDSAFYGLIFSESPYHSVGAAQIFPAEGGYSSFLFGKVVDMFYFPMVDTRLPQWMPFVGGDRFEFFRPVFNVADAAISVGVGCILVFHRSFLKNGTSEKKDDKQAAVAPAVAEEE